MLDDEFQDFCSLFRSAGLLPYEGSKHMGVFLELIAAEKTTLLGSYEAAKEGGGGGGGGGGG